jgi:hypothetical protein
MADDLTIRSGIVVARSGIAVTETGIGELLLGFEPLFDAFKNRVWEILK